MSLKPGILFFILFSVFISDSFCQQETPAKDTALAETCRYISRMTRNRPIWYGGYPVQIVSRDSFRLQPALLEKLFRTEDEVSCDKRALRAKINYQGDTLTFVWYLGLADPLIRLDSRGYFTFLGSGTQFLVIKGDGNSVPVKSHSSLIIDYGSDAPEVLKAFQRYYQLQGLKYQSMFRFPNLKEAK